MLNNYALRAKVLILAAAFFAAFGIVGSEVQAQRRSPEQGRRGAPQQGRAAPQQGQGRYGGETGQQQRMPQAARQESEPFIHGISVGAGLAVYQGDLSRNPEHNPIKYLAGNGSLSLRVGADHRLGRFDQYGLGVDLVYNRVSGETTGTPNPSFSANTLALDFYGDYELPYIRQGLFRVFLGVGPNFVFGSSYENFSQLVPGSNVKKLDSRVTGSVKVGVTILDKFRIGTRISSSDFLDGYEGFDPKGIPDFVSFLSFNYRFDLKY